MSFTVIVLSCDLGDIANYNCLISGMDVEFNWPSGY